MAARSSSRLRRPRDSAGRLVQPHPRFAWPIDCRRLTGPAGAVQMRRHPPVTCNSEAPRGFMRSWCELQASGQARRRLHADRETASGLRKRSQRSDLVSPWAADFFAYPTRTRRVRRPLAFVRLAAINDIERHRSWENSLQSAGDAIRIRRANSARIAALVGMCSLSPLSLEQRE